jgi:hypothetical protein
MLSLSNNEVRGLVSCIWGRLFTLFPRCNLLNPEPRCCASFYSYTAFLLFIVFFASILLQFKTGYGGEAGYDKTLILVLLFGATICVLVLGACFLIKDLARARKHVLMGDTTGAAIRFKKLTAERFHLFLSVCTLSLSLAPSLALF